MKLQFILPLLFILLAIVGHSAAQDDDPQTEQGKQLKKHFDEVLEKTKEAIERGKGLREDTVKKLKEIRQKLKDLDLIEQFKERIQEQKDKLNGTVEANP